MWFWTISSRYVDGWRRILVSNSFGDCASDFQKAAAKFIKKLCAKHIEVNKDNEQSLEAFTACRLIPLNKNPGLRPIGISEILRRIAGKVVVFIVKKDVITSTGSLQVCAGQEAGAEAAIPAMHNIYETEECEAVLLIDAENAFNLINRKAMLHDISIICPIIPDYITNSYTFNSRLFIIGGKEIRSKEGTKQGDLTSTGPYALGITPLIQFLHEFIIIKEQNSKEVAFGDDLAVAGKINEIKSFWDAIAKIGPKYGYFPKVSKSNFIVKNQHVDVAVVT